MKKIRIIVEEVMNGYIVTKFLNNIDKETVHVYNDAYHVADKVEEILTGEPVVSININEKTEGAKQSGTQVEIEIQKTDKVRPNVARVVPKRKVKPKHRKVAQAPVGKKSIGKAPHWTRRKRQEDF